jgi:hypothetical protein
MGTDDGQASFVLGMFYLSFSYVLFNLYILSSTNDAHEGANDVHEGANDAHEGANVPTANSPAPEQWAQGAVKAPWASSTPLNGPSTTSPLPPPSLKIGHK